VVNDKVTEIKIKKIIRSSRKTIALVVTPEADLIVRAPHRAPLDSIERFVEEQSRWIRRKQAAVKEKQESMVPKKFASGEELSYLGTYYPLVIVENGTSPLVFDGTFRLSRLHVDKAPEIFTNWYREAARMVIGERVDHYAAQSGLQYNQIKINGARTRWGSCSAKGNLNFSWRLIMAPLKIIDYVVAHELAHLAEKNHSQRFWQAVKRMDPGYQQDRRWLKDHGHLLTL
jgi:predicted metal-dependent hydrolase